MIIGDFERAHHTQTILELSIQLWFKQAVLGDVMWNYKPCSVGGGGK